MKQGERGSASYPPSQYWDITVWEGLAVSTVLHHVQTSSRCLPSPCRYSIEIRLSFSSWLCGTVKVCVLVRNCAWLSGTAECKARLDLGLFKRIFAFYTQNLELPFTADSVLHCVSNKAIENKSKPCSFMNIEGVACRVQMLKYLTNAGSKNMLDIFCNSTVIAAVYS